MDNYRDAYGDSYKAESCERWAQEDNDAAERRREAYRDAPTGEVCPRCYEQTDNDNRMVHTANRRTGEAVHACELCIEGMESNAKDARLGL